MTRKLSSFVSVSGAFEESVEPSRRGECRDETTFPCAPPPPPALDGTVRPAGGANVPTWEGSRVEITQLRLQEGPRLREGKLRA